MNLPPVGNLPVAKLAASFGNTSATYKFYWLLAILELVEEGQTTIPKRYLHALIDYARTNGTTQIAHSTVNKFTIGFSNNSKFEDEFYKTMQHYCTLKDTKFKRNVKIIELFPEERHNIQVNKKEFDGVLHQNNLPKVVFELNGQEHYQNRRTIKSDATKMELLAGKKIQLLFIPNQYVKHYEFIRELIKKFNGDVYQRTLFDNY